MKFEDILYEKKDGVAKIAINRPERLNAFRGKTCHEMTDAFRDAEGDHTIGVVVLTGIGESKSGKRRINFSIGGDATETGTEKAGYSDEMKIWNPRLHDAIRRIPKPVIAAVRGYAIGGGNVLQTLCDLTIASEDAVFGQVGPRVGSYDPGFGIAYLVRLVGEKKAREIWFCCRQYTAQEALAMGLINTVVPGDKLDEEVDKWCKEILALSPGALKSLKINVNAASDFIAGLEAAGFNSLFYYYNTEEALEARKALMEKRKPDFSKFR